MAETRTFTIFKHKKEKLMGILDKLNEGLRSAGIIEDELPEDPAKAGTPVATTSSDEEPPITRRASSLQNKTSYPITRRTGDPAMAIPPDSASTNNVRAYEPENVVDPETFQKLIDEVIQYLEKLKAK